MRRKRRRILAVELDLDFVAEGDGERVSVALEAVVVGGKIAFHRRHLGFVAGSQINRRGGDDLHLRKNNEDETISSDQVQ